MEAVSTVFGSARDRFHSRISPFFTERWLTCFVDGTLSKPCEVCIGMKGSVRTSHRQSSLDITQQSWPPLFKVWLYFSFWRWQYLDSHSHGGGWLSNVFKWRFQRSFSHSISMFPSYPPPIETQHHLTGVEKHGHLPWCPELAKPAYCWIVATNAMFRCHLESLLPLSFAGIPLAPFSL